MATVQPESDEHTNSDAENPTAESVTRVRHDNWTDSGELKGTGDERFEPTSANVEERYIVSQTIHASNALISKRLILVCLTVVFLVSMISIVLSLMALVGKACSKEFEESDSKGI